jgi:hypothetical protein
MMLAVAGVIPAYHHWLNVIEPKFFLFIFNFFLPMHIIYVIVLSKEVDMAGKLTGIDLKVIFCKCNRARLITQRNQLQQ